MKVPAQIKVGEKIHAEAKDIARVLGKDISALMNERIALYLDGKLAFEQRERPTKKTTFKTDDQDIARLKALAHKANIGVDEALRIVFEGALNDAKAHLTQAYVVSTNQK